MHADRQLIHGNRHVAQLHCHPIIRSQRHRHPVPFPWIGPHKVLGTMQRNHRLPKLGSSIRIGRINPATNRVRIHPHPPHQGPAPPPTLVPYPQPDLMHADRQLIHGNRHVAQLHCHPIIRSQRHRHPVAFSGIAPHKVLGALNR